jgi:hypothetical protein
MSQWQKVYRNENRSRAEIVKGVLESHDITAVIFDKKDSAYQLFGYFDVLVPANDVLRAIKIIDDEILFSQG